MIDLSEKFKSYANSESKEFGPILNTMLHQRKEDGRRFLNLINNVINYHLSSNTNINTETKNEINYQIIHIPACESWARELLIRFLIHKMALLYNCTTIDRIKNIIQRETHNIPEGKAGKKIITEILDKKKYLKKIVTDLNNLNIAENNLKSLLVTKEQDLINIKTDNPWIYEFFSDKIINDNDNDNYNLILSSTTTAYDLENSVRKNEKEIVPKIENLFILHSPNKSKVTNSYNIGQLERLNKYELGIKNCFIISLTEKPFRLYHTIADVKNRLSSAILQKTIRKYDDFNGFITFSQTEIDYIFGRKSIQKKIFIDCQNRDDFSQEIDQFIDHLPNNLKHKNNLALLFSDDLQKSYSESISLEIKDFSKDICHSFFAMLRKVWDHDIQNTIEFFMNDGNNSNVGFVLPKETPESVKKSLVELFKKKNQKIQEYSLDDLKDGTKDEKIVVFQYRSANGYYKPYPNSFDPIPLKNNQPALIIINKLTHNNYYEWDKYWYSISYNGLLYSCFREKVLDWKIQQFQRPSSPNVKDFIDEAESEAKAYQTEKCKIYYIDKRRPKEWLACERVIYKENDELKIAELKNISELENINIQMLNELVEQVKFFISEKSKNNSVAEEIIRREARYNLSETEIRSTTELWKFLLKRKIEEESEQIVYNDLFFQIPENERISLNTFYQWHNHENSIILPRSRKHQRALLTYLGFEIGSAYHRIILSKKMSNINDSRILNSQIETLLQKSLFNVIEDKDFDSLIESHSDIFTLLDIRSVGDLKALISLLNISLIAIERIDYDQD